MTHLSPREGVELLFVDVPEDDEEIEFIPCSKCDGHPACQDFGCAFELGLGKMVKKDIPSGSDDWG